METDNMRDFTQVKLTEHGEKMATRQRCILFLAIALLSYLLCNRLLAEVAEDRVREIAHQLRCPTCQGLSVKESEAGLSLNMKAKIRDLLAEGKSEEEILQFFKERYGEWILRNPEKRGFNLLLWLLPGAVIGLAALMVLFHLGKRAPTEKGSAAAPLSEEEESAFKKDFETLTE